MGASRALSGRFGVFVSLLVAGAMTATTGPARADVGYLFGPSCDACNAAGGLAGAGTYGAGDQFAGAPLDLGEAAPAQAGESFALSAPNFVGDFFGGVTTSTAVVQFPDQNPGFPPSIPPSTTFVPQQITLPSPSSGGLVGMQKLVENSSPIPRDRVFFNYTLFQNVRFTPAGVDVNQFVAGFEKTFLNQMLSVELRAPFASTLSSDLVAGQTGGMNTQFGNLTVYGKALLLNGPGYAVGGGLGVALPTAEDVNVRAQTGEQLARIQNQSVQLLPYFGGVYAPGDRFFGQAILQFNTVANGNPVYLINNTATGLSRVGTLNDPTWLFASVNMAYWTYRTSPTERLSGVAPLFEVHYNQTLNNTDQITTQRGDRVGSSLSNLAMTNIAAGAYLELFGRSYVSIAYIAPVTGGADRFFDGELRVLFNRLFW